MLFQGTVLGPILWNLFFEDSRGPINKSGFREITFADDLNAFKCVARSVRNTTVMRHAKKCQAELHKWGDANKVAFDGSKENFCVISRFTPEGEGFDLLGLKFDTGLYMDEYIFQLRDSANWKLRNLFRTRRYYDTATLITQYKTMILGYIEYRTAGIYNCCSSLLQHIDKIQGRLLQSLDVTSTEALMEYHVAPLSSRRDIAMLGVIHRAVLGDGPDHFRKFFIIEGGNVHPGGREDVRRHSFQLQTYRRGHFLELASNSILGLVDIYNLLPASVVAAKTVRNFQQRLQGMLKVSASEEQTNWDMLFSPRSTLFNHKLREVRVWEWQKFMRNND